MTNTEYNECCLENPRPGDVWKELVASAYFWVVERKSLDEIVILKAFGADSAKINNEDGTYSLDYSKGIVVDREWMRNKVTYSSDRKSFVADCYNTERSRKIASEYKKFQEENKKPSFEEQVSALQGSIADMKKQLEELLKMCPHTNTRKMKRYFHGGYDHVSESHHWDECVVCGTIQNKTVNFGSYQ